MKKNFIGKTLLFLALTIISLGIADFVSACTTNADCVSTPNTPTCFSINANDPSQCSCGFDTTGTFIPCSGGGSFGVNIKNPLGDAGINDANSLVSKVIDYVSILITSLAVIVMVYGGILFVFSAGNEARLGTAKKCIFWAVVGLVIGLGGEGIKLLVEAVFKV